MSWPPQLSDLPRAAAVTKYQHWVTSNNGNALSPFWGLRPNSSVARATLSLAALGEDRSLVSVRVVQIPDRTMSHVEHV